MIRKLICASMLVTSSVPVLGQDASRRASADMFLKFPALHRCTVTPSAQWHAINTKGTGTTSGIATSEISNPIPSVGVVVKKNVARTAMSATPMNAAGGRIDLEFTASAPTGGGIPTVSGHAINTKGTGANSGRTSSDATVSCTATAIGADGASQKASMSDISITSDPVKRGAGWSCAVTGSDEAPQFVLTWSAPTQGTRGNSRGAGRSEWSWGTSNSGSHRVSIVPRGSKVAGASLVACASKDKPIIHNWDLATNTKM